MQNTDFVNKFQPTRPLRGATITNLFIKIHGLNFNPRAPCGARHDARDSEDNKDEFQPTRPLRGATIMDWFGDTFYIISTHAPLAGRDFRS